MSRLGCVGLAVLLAGLGPKQLLAQQRVSLDDLRPPAAPAFTLLGIAPTMIERPTSPRSLAVGLLSAAGKGDLLPKSYALEVAPFWLLQHPNLTYDDYYHPKLGPALFQSLALSLATTPLSDTANLGTAVGFGARTLLVPGRPQGKLQSFEQRLRATQDSMNRAVHEREVRLEPVIQAIEDSVDRLGLTAQKRDQLVDSLTTALASAPDARLSRLESQARDVATAMQQLDKERVGWQAELAGAVVLDYPSNAADSARLARVGAWLTLAHRAPGALDLIGVVRYSHDRRVSPARDLLDFGGRLAWEGGGMTLSGEFLDHVGPQRAGVSPSYRLGFNLEYSVDKWGKLVATVASDDKPGTAGTRGLVTSLGIDLGFGSLPILVGTGSH